MPERTHASYIGDGPAFPPDPPPSGNVLPASVDAGHEVTGASVHGLLWFILSFIAVMIIILIFLWLLLALLVHFDSKTDVAVSPVTDTQPVIHDQPLQPSVNHIVLPWADLAKLHSAQIDASVAEGQKMGVNSTPTFFVNSQIIKGAQPLAEFREIIDEAIN